MNAFPVQHVANADHPRIVELVIAADLTAASKAGLAGSRAAPARENVGHVNMRKRGAGVGADVTSGPNTEAAPAVCRPELFLADQRPMPDLRPDQSPQQ